MFSFHFYCQHYQMLLATVCEQKPPMDNNVYSQDLF